MKVIDSHVHFWDLANNINGWVQKRTHTPELIKNYLPDAMVENFKHDLSGVVHIEAHDNIVPTITEVEWLGKIMQGMPNLLYRHIACVNITLPHSEFKQMIDKLKEHKNVVGIRHILSFNPKFSYSPCANDQSINPNIYDNLKYLAKVKLVFDCQMYPYQLNNILPAILDSGVTCVMDHFALPAWNKIHDDDHQLWQDTLIKLSKLLNIFIKLSGLSTFRKESEFQDVINFCLDNFPASQLIYGSNYPVSYTNNCNYWYEYLNKLNISMTVKEQIFFKNALNVFFNDK